MVSGVLVRLCLLDYFKVVANVIAKAFNICGTYRYECKSVELHWFVSP